MLTTPSAPHLPKVCSASATKPLGVAAQPGLAQRAVEEAELLLHDVRLGVVGDALAEHGGHQLVGLALADLVVAHAEVPLLRGVAGHRHADGAGQAQAEDVAEHGAAAGDHLTGPVRISTA
jgi:hypothetical protein